MEDFALYFSYGFFIKAIIVGSLISLCAALLGVPLVLKKYSMIGDGLSHVAFGALTVAMLLNASPLLVSIPVVLLAAFLLLRITRNSRLNGDSAIAVISCSALAIGIIAISVNSGMNTDVQSLMFGSILAISNSDVILSVVVSLFVIVIYILFFNRIFAVTFDESFSNACGIDTGIYNTVIALLTALTTVIGMRIMGALLISGIIIFPALSAMKICKTFKSVVCCSAVISIVCFWGGIVMSAIFSLPTGASIVFINLILFVLTGAVGLKNQ